MEYLEHETQTLAQTSTGTAIKAKSVESPFGFGINQQLAETGRKLRFKPGKEKASPLPSLSVNPDLIIVGGTSSGSGMSMIMHVAYSDTFKGSVLLYGVAYG